MIKSVQARNEAYGKPIAIIGIGCRFPGGVTNPEEFWQMILNKTDTISEVPADRWNFKKFYHPTVTKPGKSYARWGGFLKEDVHAFDPLFFGISPREAEGMDPQQRYVLQVAYEALEDAGLPLQDLRGSNTGVYIGGFTLDNKLTQLGTLGLPLVDSSTATSCTMAILSNRLSHAFDLRGPSLSVDTACSSSLVATHLACRSLWDGDCEVAIAGGVTIMTRPEYPISMSNGGFLSKHGRCMAFDERAEGYTRGEGCGVVILKPLEAAVADGDSIYSVIRNTGINQDGATKGIAAPNGDSQRKLIERVYAQAGLSPSDVHVVEAHGTGTQAGDTTECRALDQVLSRTAREQKAVVGSVKTNIGHLEAAAGVAGLIKASLMVNKGAVLPNIHFERPNPEIPFERMSLRIPTESEPWPGQGIRRASVNSFGYGGTNAHAVVESFEQGDGASSEEGTGNDRLLLPVTAQDETALRKLCARYADHLDGVQTEADLRDVLHSAAHRRSFLRHRVCVIGANQAELQARLRQWAAGEAVEEACFGQSKRETSEVPLVYIFTGMGPQWHGMGQELFASEPVFRDFVQQADQLFQKISGWSILEEMQKGESSSRMSETAIAQPANFVLQVGICEVLSSYGNKPDLVVGHSVGEVAAAYVSGALSLEEALMVSFQRSRLQATLAGTGKMLACGCGESEVLELLQAYDDVQVAAVNSPTSVTVAGEESQLLSLGKELEQRDVFQRLLTVEVPYHSSRMDAIRGGLLASLGALKPKQTRVPMYSTVTSTLVEGKELDAEYWWRNVRQPVRFAKALAQIVADEGAVVCLEVGPHPVLRASIKEVLQDVGAPALQVHSFHRKQAESDSMSKTLGRLFALGVNLDWPRVNGFVGSYVKLPAYPWTLSTYRRISNKGREELFDNEGHVYFAREQESVQPSWEVELNAQYFPYLEDHKVQGDVVFPGAAYVEAGLALGLRQQGLTNSSSGSTKSGVCLQNVRLHRVLIDQESVQTHLQVSFDSDVGDYAVHSRVVDDQSRWSQNASGQILLDATPELGEVQWESGAGESLDVEQFYTELEAFGLSYGECFRTIDYLERYGESGVVSRLVQAECADSCDRFYVLHPTLLDGAFQSMLALLEPIDRRPFVPVGIERIHVAGKLPRTMHSLAELVSVQADQFVGRITLFDDEGHVLATLEGVQFQRLSDRLEGQDALMGAFHRMDWVPTDLEPEVVNEARSWLILGGGDAADLCGAALTQAGIRNQESSACSKEEVAASIGVLRGVTDVLYLGVFEEELALSEQETLETFSRIRELAQALIETHGRETVRLHVVTQAAHKVFADDDARNVVGASLNALGLLIENEHSNIECFFSDVSNFSELSDHLPSILFGPNSIRERAFRGQKCFRQVLSQTHLASPERKSATKALQESEVAIRLKDIGDVTSFFLQEQESQPLHAHQVRIRVRASSLNFKDLLKVYGQIDSSAIADTYCGDTLGLEASGVIVAVGESVTDFELGEEVVAVLPDSFRSFANVRADYVIKKPANVSLLEAPALIGYMTVYYGLFTKAELGRGERVLIHNATGGVGLIALQAARWKGAEVFATAGTPEKRQYLRDQGVQHVYDSRSLAFAEELRRDTGGSGVDVVLNAMSGQALPQSFELLAPFGRFVEIGKKSIVENRDLPMRAFQENLTFCAIDIDRMMHSRSDLVVNVLQGVSEAFDSGCFGSLPIQVFPASDVKEAFQHMARSKHIGKLILDFEGEGRVEEANQNNSRIRPDGAYLVTGGTRGFGMEIAKWLASQGAGQLILVSRSGDAAESTKREVGELLEQGVKVEVHAVDVGEAEQVEQLMTLLANKAECGEGLSLRGVFHAAVALEDAFLASLSQESLERVLKSKAMSALHLHRFTSQMPLDIFFCFSSISAIVGNQGQAAYVLANAYLDALCQHRRSIGLCGTSLNWGAISDVGIVSRKDDVAVLFRKLGLENLSPSEACQMLDRVLEEDPIQLGAFRVDWGSWARNYPGMAEPSFRFLEFLVDESRGGVGGDLLKIREQLLGGCSNDDAQETLVLSTVLEQISELLKIPASQLEPGVSINDMGIDSLAAVELGIALRESVGVDFSSVQLLSGPTPEDLAGQVMAVLTA